MMNTTNTVEQNNSKLDDEALDTVQAAMGFQLPPGGVTKLVFHSEGGSKGGVSWGTMFGGFQPSHGGGWQPFR